MLVQVPLTVGVVLLVVWAVTVGGLSSTALAVLPAASVPLAVTLL